MGVDNKPRSALLSPRGAGYMVRIFIREQAPSGKHASERSERAGGSVKHQASSVKRQASERSERAWDEGASITPPTVPDSIS